MAGNLRKVRAVLKKLLTNEEANFRTNSVKNSDIVLPIRTVVYRNGPTWTSAILWEDGRWWSSGQDNGIDGIIGGFNVRVFEVTRSAFKLGLVSDEDLIKFTDWFYDTDSAIRTQSEIERLYRDATALGFKVERKKLT